MPGPVSATSIVAFDPFCSARSTISPATVCLTALPTRFETTCSTMSRWPTATTGFGHSTRTSTPSAGELAAAISLSRPRSSTGSSWRFCCFVCARARSNSELERRVRRVACRSIRSMKRSRLSGWSSAPALSASTALAIAVTGVRSSCDALVTNSRSACRRRSCSVMSAKTSTARSDDDAGTPTSEIIAPSSRRLRASATGAPGTNRPSATRRSGSPPCVSGSGAPFSSDSPVSSSFAFSFANWT